MKRADLVLPILLLLSVVCILIPLPGWILDVLLSLNLLFAVLLFAGALHIKDPLEITGLPSVLLLAALVRLSLNLATTRSILTTGHAGELVATFGSFVVGGNLLVGLVLFILLTIVQFLVVAKGSERVAEVSARFTLDALPGKQMSIDADVRAGLLDAEGARRKRQDLQTESRFYGALDGAMKFVKGDAIAGMIITGVNLIGGFMIGLLMKDMSLEQASRTYSLLSIGDGLLSQLPSLLNAVAAGMIVTRVARSEAGSLSTELLSQMGGLRTARVLAATLSALLAFIPGMPYLVFGAIALAGFGSAILDFSRSKVIESAEGRRRLQSFEPNLPTTLSISGPLEVLQSSYHDIVNRCQDLRSEIFERTGILLDVVSIAPAGSAQKEICIQFHGATVWKSQSENCNAELLAKVLATIIDESLEDLIDDGMTRRLLDLVEKKNPEIVTTLIPTVLSVTQLTGILRSLVREGIPIHGVEAILQVAAECGVKASERRIEMEARLRLRRAISHKIAPNQIVEAHLVHPIIDVAISHAEERATMIPESIYRAVTSYPGLSNKSVVIAGKRARPYLRDVLRSQGISATVIAREELLPDVEIRQVGLIELGANESEEVIDALAA